MMVHVSDADPPTANLHPVSPRTGFPQKQSPKTTRCLPLPPTANSGFFVFR
jgi:hypothetical protein